MAHYTINDLEKLSGIKTHTLRIWEKRYQLFTPQRTETNYRIYSDSDLRKLLNIIVLYNHGYKISKIAKLSQEELVERVLEIEKDEQAEVSLERFILSVITLNEQELEIEFNNHVSQHGLEYVFQNILCPLFDRVGILWQTQTILTAHEHFLSHFVRKKLVAAIDRDAPTVIEQSKKGIAFLPEGETHELSLLFYTYVLRKQGIDVTYLGQSVPLSDVEDILSKRSYDYVFTSVSIPMDEKLYKEFNRRLTSHFKNKPVFVTGYLARQKKINFSNNFYPIDSIKTLKNLLQELSFC